MPFKVRTLNDKYVANFMDATYSPLKRQTVLPKKQSIFDPIGYTRDRQSKDSTKSMRVPSD